MAGGGTGGGVGWGLGAGVVGGALRGLVALYQVKPFRLVRLVW